MTHQQNKKYVFVQKEGADWTGIKLLDEKYKDNIRTEMLKLGLL